MPNGKNRATGASALAHLGLRAWHWVGTLSEIISMKFKHVVGLLCCRLDFRCAGGIALAQEKTVKIGAIYPLSGNAASAGVHAKAAIETAVDIINNGASRSRQSAADEECRSAGLGGAKVEVVFADNQGSPATGQNQALAPDHRREGGRAQRRLSVRHYADDQRDRRKIRHSLCERRVGRRQPDRARLQMVLPHHAGRRPISQRSISTFSRT